MCTLLMYLSYIFSLTIMLLYFFFFFFFNDTATTEIYTLSLHDALPILGAAVSRPGGDDARPRRGCALGYARGGAGAADQRARAAARQVRRPVAFPVARAGHHAPHPAPPRLRGRAAAPGRGRGICRWGPVCPPG